MGNKVTTLGGLKTGELIDLGLRMPDGSAELFEAVHTQGDYVVVMTKNIIDFTPYNKRRGRITTNIYYASTVREYLLELYQTVVKRNELLEQNMQSADKEFFLPFRSAIGLEGDRGVWSAFEGDKSRIKQLGVYASTKEWVGEQKIHPHWWLESVCEGSKHSVYYVDSRGCLSRGETHYNYGVTPCAKLKTSAAVVYIDGAWHLYEPDASEVSYKESAGSENITVGDWVDVVNATNADNEARVFAGDVCEVVGIEGGGVCIQKGPRTHHFLSVGKFQKNKRVSNKNRATQTEVGVNKRETLVRSYMENLSEMLVAKEGHCRSGSASLAEKLKQLNDLLEEEARLNKAINDSLIDIASHTMSELITREDRLSDRSR